MTVLEEELLEGALDNIRLIYGDAERLEGTTCIIYKSKRDTAELSYTKHNEGLIDVVNNKIYPPDYRIEPAFNGWYTTIKNKARLEKVIALKKFVPDERYTCDLIVYDADSHTEILNMPNCKSIAIIGNKLSVASDGGIIRFTCNIEDGESGWQRQHII